MDAIRTTPASPESKFPTIKDLRDTLNKLIEKGFGELSVQITVVPDSTLQAIAFGMGNKSSDKPAIMIEFEPIGGRISASFISEQRLSGNGMKTRQHQ